MKKYIVYQSSFSSEIVEQFDKKSDLIAYAKQNGTFADQVSVNASYLRMG